MARYAVINEQTKKVVNVIELEEKSRYIPPVGQFIVKSDIGNIGNEFVMGNSFLNIETNRITHKDKSLKCYLSGN